MTEVKEQFTTNKVYEYNLFSKFWPIVFGSLFAFVSAGILVGLPILFVYAFVKTGTINLFPDELLGFGFVWVLLVPLFPSMLCYVNLFSDIQISDNYLSVRFYFRESRIPWEYIHALRRRTLVGQKLSLVGVSPSYLPWIYAVYGWAYGQGKGRYIPIFSSINRYQDLMREIKKRSPNMKHL